MFVALAKPISNRNTHFYTFIFANYLFFDFRIIVVYHIDYCVYVLFACPYSFEFYYALSQFHNFLEQVCQQ